MNHLVVKIIIFMISGFLFYEIIEQVSSFENIVTNVFVLNEANIGQNYESTTEDFIHVMSNTYELRKKYVTSTCSALGFPTGNQEININISDPLDYSEIYYKYVDARPLYKNLLFLPKWNLTYCWTRKTASTSWNQVFHYLHFNKKISESKAHEVASKLYPKYNEYNQAMKSLKFYFVRHPFERLVSCYKDKFETGSRSDYIFKKFNPSIIKSMTDRPTFTEFVEYLIRTPIEHYNDHWLPNWIHCQLCTQNYDIIGHMETLDIDVKYILEKTGLENYLNVSDFTFPIANQNEDIDRHQKSTKEYIGRLTSAQRQKLLEIYLPDFLMFGYDINYYDGT